ncbi:MAG: DUF952 domain-containing protein [Bacteroidota bacterium]
MIFHLTTPAHWEKCLNQAHFDVPTRKTEGFIHCSTEEQVLGSATKHFQEADSLVILCIREKGVKNILKWEPSRKGALFPHLYGKIPFHAIVDTRLLERDPAGHWQWAS